MGDSDDYEAMVEVCLKAHAAVAKNGTAEMLTVMQVLLFQIGLEITRREAELRDPSIAPKPLSAFQA